MKRGYTEGKMKIRKRRGEERKQGRKGERKKTTAN